jgi:hypothetical protein
MARDYFTVCQISKQRGDWPFALIGVIPMRVLTGTTL